MRVDVLSRMCKTSTMMLSRMWIVLARGSRIGMMMLSRMWIASIRVCRIRMIRVSSREDAMAGKGLHHVEF